MSRSSCSLKALRYSIGLLIAAPAFDVASTKIRVAPVRVLFALAVLGTSLASLAANGSSPVARVSGGSVRGERLSDASVAFRGIPYAKPPVGNLRWRPPEPVSAWRGVRDATKPGAPCLQAALGWNDNDAARSSEDCLYLDVRTPQFPTDARLPVMVWIHGGANWAGSGSGYLASNIVRRGVVLVTVQYRLGVFGFLSHPALTAESPHRSSGNYALLDQIAALHWVQANIARFGGDAANVTLFGHSAGGQDVGLLMLSPLARGLFAKAIEQSGTAGFGLPARSLAENERIGQSLAAGLGLPIDAEGLQVLRKASGTRLLSAAANLDVPALHDDSYIWLQATVDGWVLPRAPAEMLAAGESHAVPLLIGSNTRELPLTGGLGYARFAVESAFGEHASRALELYGLSGTGNPAPAAESRLGDVPTQIATDTTFRCPVVTVSRLHTAAGRRVWQYQLDVAAPGANEVQHGSELAYVFDDLRIGQGGDPPPTLQAYWTNFARAGDPNSAGLPHWPAYDRAQAAYLELTTDGPQVKTHLRSQFCDLLSAP